MLSLPFLPASFSGGDNKQAKGPEARTRGMAEAIYRNQKSNYSLMKEPRISDILAPQAAPFVCFYSNIEL